MQSGPGALSGLRPCNNFVMPFTDMAMSVMHVYLFLASGGHYLGYSDLILGGPELSAGRAVRGDLGVNTD